MQRKPRWDIEVSIICGCRAAGRYRRQEGQLTLAMIAQRTSVERRTRAGDPKDLVYYVVMHDPKCNEFCVS